jgi:hypothetical protein
MLSPEKTPQQIRYQVALYVAQGLRIFAVLSVIGGIILAIDGAMEVSEVDGNVAEFLGYAFGATALAGLILAFFGYTLEVLIDIWENTWVSRTIAEEQEDDVPPGDTRAAA